MSLREDGDFVDQLYEATVEPERFDALIVQWDARLAQSGDDLEHRLADIRSETFLRHVERAIAVLDSLNAFEFQELDGHLAAVPSPAVVFALSGAVVASNEAARTAYALYPGSSVRSIAADPGDLHALAEALGRIALRPEEQGEILRCRSLGGRRDVHVHLRPVEGRRGLRHVLMVSSELPWDDAVGEIALDTDRRESTIRSQLHAILAKTGTESRAEVLRLAGLLQTSLALDPGRSLRAFPALLAEPPSRQIRLPDGRPLTVLRFGDPQGRTVLWLPSPLGLFTPTRSGEADLRRLGILVPIRAGYGPSDPAPPRARRPRGGRGRPPGRDGGALDRAGAGCDAAGRHRDRAGAKGTGPRRPCAEHRHGLPDHATRALPPAPPRRPLLPRLRPARAAAPALPDPPDPRPDDPERHRQPCAVEHALARRSRRHRRSRDLRAWMAGFTYLYGNGRASEEALCAELRRSHRDWPRELGHVACPVTLLHGEEDGNNPYETAREMVESYLGWRFTGRPGAGQLAVYVCWDEALALLCRTLEDGVL